MARSRFRRGAGAVMAVSPYRRHRAQRDAERARTTPQREAGGAPPQHSPDPVTGITVLDTLLDKAVAVPSAAVHEHVRRVRARNPHATPAQVIDLLGKRYLLAVAASGGAVGAAAAAPAVGTGASLALTSSEVATFFAASSAYALAVASVHGIEVTETSRRRTLLLATVLGEQGSRLVGTQTGLSAAGWARAVLVNMPTSTIKQVNRVLTRRIVRTQLTRQSALAIGRVAPFGIGAVIGIGGARAMGRTVITGAQRAFGPPPDRFPQVLELPAHPADVQPPRLASAD
ncbi:hypothetical protein Q6348_05665 [Isoptericola sp. b441]|uniref:EcsC family protein n=1 Tax=Actinotalea lenta TaxID=3064654 RepID=A0ABT9D753_9CELL|nr:MULTISPECIES: hypothetical protein [unclassified Isoptericola]MDO8106683.1 hypothetical protein [Isoptericola sp. b441]MDO8121609.1 hypothetical protein [Isoptericola sp. b490]